jgi:hypothetical protein
MDTIDTVQVASVVPATLANDIKHLAEQSERSMAAEIRLALRAWVDAARLEQTA